MTNGDALSNSGPKRVNSPTMSDPLSRRHWLGLVTTASLGSGLVGANHARADTVDQAAAPDVSAGARVYNVREHGAKGDGLTLDTPAVRAAIDACHRDGGGTVLVPAGVFHIGTVELKSNVTLHLSAAGTLLGSADGKQYHAVDAIPLRGDSTLGDGNWALIFAVDARNIAIEGPGLIDGQGLQFHSPTRGVPPPSGLGGNSRPYHLLFHRCERVRVQNVRLFQSAYHSVRVIQSRSVKMDGLNIYSGVNSNNDGFHFISCEFVTVSNCIVQAQDDGCALFGSCKQIAVTNCTFSTRWSVFRFGGGEAENVTVSNCVLHQVYGCPITLNAVGGAILERISFDNIHLTFGGGGTAEDAARRDLPEVAGEYFMLGPMPAYGLYARNARGVTLQNVRFEVAQPDLRPALILDRVEDVAINGFSVQGNPQAESVLRFIDSKQILLPASRLLTRAAAFLQLEGGANDGITIDGGDIAKAAAPLAFVNGATKHAVKLRA